MSLAVVFICHSKEKNTIVFFRLCVKPWNLSPGVSELVNLCGLIPSTVFDVGWPCSCFSPLQAHEVNPCYRYAMYFRVDWVQNLPGQVPLRCGCMVYCVLNTAMNMLRWTVWCYSYTSALLVCSLSILLVEYGKVENISDAVSHDTWHIGTMCVFLPASLQRPCDATFVITWSLPSFLASVRTCLSRNGAWWNVACNKVRKM